MNTLVTIAAVVAVLTLPVMYLAEWKLGSKRWMKVLHAVFAVGGVLTVTLDSLLLNKLASELRTPDLGGWIKDFYFGYLWMALPVVLVITALLCLAAAIRHPMVRVRGTLTVLLPVAAVLTAFAVALLSENSDFAVDVYIRTLGVGMALLPHAVPLCERYAKNPKK